MTVDQPAPLRQRLLAAGVPADEVAATDDDLLAVLGVEHLMGTGAGRYDHTEVEARSGVSHQLANRLWRALGFPDVPEGERAFTDADVEALRIAATALDRGLLDVEEVLQVTRVIASATARVAESQIDLVQQQGDDVSSEPLAATPHLLEFAWRRQLQAAARRTRMRASGAEAGESAVAVGFADLVGFTALSQQLDAHELGELVERFTGLAYDLVAVSGGRVVKTIGDEVMFVVDELRPGVELALALGEAYAGDRTLSDVRVGLAWGGVVSRDGDVFGPVVNLASRIVNIARPASVVVGPDVHDRLEDDESLAWRSIRARSLKGIGRVPLWVVRRAG